MPRRCIENEEMAIGRKMSLEECSSLDVSFFDDEALSPGIVFTDVSQRRWRIGKPIGRGSFGRIYLASDDVDKEVTKLNARYVIKIEPHTNGPLFVEVHCMIRSGQIEKVKSWRQQHRQKRLGMPLYIASGSFTEKSTGIKYRFLVLPRYDVDLQKVISRTKVLDPKNVLIIAIQILDVLEYLHSQGYTHSDIKSSNLMLGFDGNKFKVQTPKVQSFQKDTKQPVVLSRKPKIAKSTKSRSSNYYEDDDFIVKDRLLINKVTDKKLASVKQKISKILSNEDRDIIRHHAFNLRQLTNYVNYSDKSTTCSERLYQKKDDLGKLQDNFTNCKDLNDIYKDAILAQSNGQVYLLDYGLASKFVDSDGKHKEFGMDARKAHDGTLEYSSRDSHIGAHSRRSDLETLGFNLLDWLTGFLPWKTSEVLSEPDLVHALKKNFMGDIKLLLKTCFRSEFYPQFMEKFLHYITTLEFTEKPDYDYCRSLFMSELIKSGYIFDKELSVKFDDTPKSHINRNCYSMKLPTKNTSSDFLGRNSIKKSHQNENILSIERDLKLKILKRALNTSSEGKSVSSRNFFVSDQDLVARLRKSLKHHDLIGRKLSPKNLRSKKIIKCKGIKRHRNSIGKFGNFMGSARQFTWAEILAGNPENIIRKERNQQNEDFDDDSTCKYRIRKLSSSSDSNTEVQSPLLQKDYLQGLNPTYAMKEVLDNFRKRISGKHNKEMEETLHIAGYTPAMLKIYKIREKSATKPSEAVHEEETIRKRCTRSMANKKIELSEEKEKNNKAERKAKKSLRTINKKVNIAEESTNKTDNKKFSEENVNAQKLPKRSFKLAETNHSANNNLTVSDKNLPENSIVTNIKCKTPPETKCKVATRILPLRKCKLKQNKQLDKNYKSPKKVNSDADDSPKVTKALSVILKRLDIKELSKIKKPAAKRPSVHKKKIAPINRRKLRSSERNKKIVHI